MIFVLSLPPQRNLAPVASIDTWAFLLTNAKTGRKEKVGTKAAWKNPEVANNHQRMITVCTPPKMNKMYLNKKEVSAFINR